MNKKIENIIDELIDQYLDNDRYNRPWIIGYSGGKDSTALLTLVWLALQKILESNPKTKLKRYIYVVCNNTMVENPIIEEYVQKVLNTLRKASKEQNLPIVVETTTPKLERYFLELYYRERIPSSK